MYLIQVLLPIKGPNGAFPPALVSETRSELVNTFGGVTAYLRTPAAGAWTAPDGTLERDEVVMIEVVTTNFDRGWWAEYSGILAQRFGQDTIHIRAIAVETV
jgi:hypothetical protein